MFKKNDLFKSLCVGLLLITMTGCNSNDKVEPLPTQTPTAGEEALLEVVTYEQYEKEFVKVKEEVKNAFSEDYVFSSEENDQYLKVIADGYETLYDGVFKSNIDVALEVFRAASMLQSYSDDDLYKSLGESANEYVLSYLGFNAGDSLVILDSFYSSLITLSDKLEKAPTQPKWYTEIDTTGTETELEVSEK